MIVFDSIKLSEHDFPLRRAGSAFAGGKKAEQKGGGITDSPYQQYDMKDAKAMAP